MLCAAEGGKNGGGWGVARSIEHSKNFSAVRIMLTPSLGGREVRLFGNDVGSNRGINLPA